MAEEWRGQTRESLVGTEVAMERMYMLQVKLDFRLIFFKLRLIRNFLCFLALIRVQRKSFFQLAFTSPDVISTSSKNFLTSRIDFTVLL